MGDIFFYHYFAKKLYNKMLKKTNLFNPESNIVSFDHYLHQSLSASRAFLIIPFFASTFKFNKITTF